MSFLCVCGEVIRLLLKYCIYCALAPSLHRESTDSLIMFVDWKWNCFVVCQCSKCNCHQVANTICIRSCRESWASLVGDFDSCLKAVRSTVQKVCLIFTWLVSRSHRPAQAGLSLAEPPWAGLSRVGVNYLRLYKWKAFSCSVNLLCLEDMWMLWSCLPFQSKSRV